MTDILKALEQKRPGYDEELVWHRFLMDAYLGTGGFAGKISQPPSGFWGPASEMYALTTITRSAADTIDTYLDRYGREDTEKFRQRANSAEYHNYCEAITDLKVSYVLRKELDVRGRPQAIADWRENVDGNGATWAELYPNIVASTAVLGWRPVLIDARAMPTDDNGQPLVRNAAQAREMGLRPYPVPLFPANLVDYALDDAGSFRFVKLRTRERRQAEWSAKAEDVTVYTVWTPEDFIRFEVDEQRNARQVAEGPNPFGAVPLVIYQHKPAPEDPIRAMPMSGNVSQVARAHLNRLSEFNEHLRGQVFAVLVMSMKSGIGAEDVTIGTDNALILDSEARQPHAYLAPPSTVAETYEKRLENIVREMYRVARVEYTRATGTATSGEAHAYEFQQTNRALSDFAQQLAKAEMQVDWLVGRYLNVTEDELRSETITAPDTFDIENLTADIKDAFDLIAGGIGATATKLLKMRLVKQALRNLDADTLAVIESELDEEATQDAADEALANEARAALAERRAGTAPAEPEADEEDDADDPSDEAATGDETP